MGGGEGNYVLLTKRQYCMEELSFSKVRNWRADWNIGTSQCYSVLPLVTYLLTNNSIRLATRQNKERECNIRDIGARSYKHCLATEKWEVLKKCSEYVFVDLGIQHVMWMCIVLDFYLKPACLYQICLHYLKRKKGWGGRGGKIFRKTSRNINFCILIFSKTLFETFLILRRIQRGIIMYKYVVLKICPLFLSEVKVKVKVRFALEQATKSQMWSRCIAVLFLQLRR
jgi:hypothetical protein